MVSASSTLELGFGYSILYIFEERIYHKNCPNYLILHCDSFLHSHCCHYYLSNTKLCHCSVLSFIHDDNVTSGAIAGVATDPDGSRFVQKRIKLGSDDERKLALKEAILSITTLWQDTSGNYILQQLLEHGNQDVKKELMEAIEKEDVIALSLHMHG